MIVTRSPVRAEQAPPENARQDARKSTYLLLWWLDQTPQAACVDDPAEAEAAARERNATLIEIQGEAEIARVLDFWRRDDAGRPMSAKWKDLNQPVLWRIPLVRLRSETGSATPDP